MGGSQKGGTREKRTRRRGKIKRKRRESERVEDIRKNIRDKKQTDQKVIKRGP